MKYVEEWKENEVNAIYEDYAKWSEKLEQLRQEWKNGVENGFNIMQSHKYSNKQYYTLTYCGDQSEEHIKKIIRVWVEKHFETLQARVEKKIGKIIEIWNVNGNTYGFKGELDDCFIEVILAGGYNIQRLHTRWVITKNINRY